MGDTRTQEADTNEIDGQDELTKIIEMMQRLDRDAKIRVLAAAAIFFGVKEDIAG